MGTSVCCSPRETTIVTSSPRSALAPPAGLWRITSFSGASESRSSTFTSSRARVSRVSAASRVRPTTSGTLICAGPELTNSRTREPRSTDVPSLGEVRVAKPLRTVSDASVSAVTSSPCFCSSLMARWREVLRTEGTRTLPGPLETISVIVSFAAAVSPASGSWRSTVSTSALLRSRSTCDLLEPVALEPVARLGQLQPLDLGHRLSSGRVKA